MKAVPGLVISLNRGKNEGLEIGHVLALYRDRSPPAWMKMAAVVQTALPEERYALAFRLPGFQPGGLCPGGRILQIRHHRRLGKKSVIESEGLAAWLRLTLIPGIGGETQRKLLAAFGLPEADFRRRTTGGASRCGQPG
jgi:hypothetical protein